MMFIKENTLSIFGFLLILGIVVASYSSSIDGPFVFDDKLNILENEYVRMHDFNWESVKRAWHSNRPVSMLSFSLNFFFDQYNPRGYHYVNIVLHCITGLLLFLLSSVTLRLIHRDNHNDIFKLVPLVASGLWIVNPIHTQSVTYIVQRMNILAALFYLLTLLLYIYGRLERKKKKKGVFWFFAVISGLMSIGSKEIAITLPVFIVLYEWYFFKNLDFAWFKKILLPLSLVGLVVCLLGGYYVKTRYSQYFSQGYSIYDFNMVQRLLTEPRVVLYYISLLFYPNPIRFNLDYDYPVSYSLFEPVSTLFSILIIAGSIWAALYFAKRERILSFSILWYFGNLVVESTVLPLDLVFEHRTYLPSMMVFFCLAYIIFKYQNKTKVVLSLFICTVLLCAFWTYERNRVWSNWETLWEDCLKKSPNKARPYMNYGSELGVEGEIERAIHYYKRAVALKKDYYEAWFNLGEAYHSIEDINGAIRSYSKAIAVNSKGYRAYVNLGAIYLDKKKYDAAEEFAEHVLKKRPSSLEALSVRAVVMEETGRSQEAIQIYKKMIDIQPSRKESYFYLSLIYIDESRYDEAKEMLLKAVDIDNNYIEANNTLATLYYNDGNYKSALWHVEAVLESDPENEKALNIKKQVRWQDEKESIKSQIVRFEEELKADPDNQKALSGIGALYIKIGEPLKAVAAYKKLIGINPDLFMGYNNLAVAYLASGDRGEAVTVYKQMLQKQPENTLVYYNIGCVYAMEGNPEESVKWLRRAVEKGYNDFDYLKNDKDLSVIKDSKEFKQFLKEIS